MNLKQILINKINKSQWWHVPPQDPRAYKKRGKFMSSTFTQGLLYGRPNGMPEQVRISNPIYGTAETKILKQLFPKEYRQLYQKVLKERSGWYKRRIALDAKMYRRAKSLGYDAVVLLGRNGLEYLKKSRKPHSIELNLLHV